MSVEGRVVGLNRRQFLRQSSVGLTAGWLLPQLDAAGANDRISIGIIGCGTRGRHLFTQLARNRESCNVTVLAVCDVWRVARERMADQVEQHFGARPLCFSRYQELLELKHIDGVTIATPDFLHSPILSAAARAGKDAYCEKPMALTLDQANDAVAVVRENQRVVQIGTQRRSSGQFRAAADLIRSGALGRLVEIETGWHDDKPRWDRSSDDLKAKDVDWPAFLDELPARPFDARRLRCWQLYRDYSLGPVGLLGSHLIDVATWLAGEPYPRSAVAHGGTYIWTEREQPDLIECLFEFPSGFLLRYSTRLANSRVQPEVTVYGTRGTFDTDSWAAHPEGGGSERLPEPVVAEPEPSVGHVRNWLDCMRSRQDPNATVEMGHAHSVAAILGNRAMWSGRKQIFDSERQAIRGV